MRLSPSIGDGDKDLLLTASILDMKSLHTIWPRERGCLHSRRKSVTRVECKFGAVIIATPPRQPKARSEEIIHGVHCYETGEMQTDDSDATISYVG